jgi:hypothetical protein
MRPDVRRVSQLKEVWQMANPKRRRSDQAPIQPVVPQSGSRQGRAREPWVVQCASRLVDIDRDLSYDNAVEIALAAKEFERTGAMEPGAAAEFVANEMSKPEGLRFERRRAS